MLASAAATTGLFVLAGVVVGGLVTGAVNFAFDYRRERASLRVAMRLLESELESAAAFADSRIKQGRCAAVDWGYIGENSAKRAGRNPQPPPRPVRPYTFAELDAIALELSPEYEPLPDFAAATGLRPEEGMALERRDVDRAGV